MAPLSDLQTLLRGLEPVVNEGVYVYCCLAQARPPEGRTVLGTFREAEGWTVIVEEGEARQRGWPALFRAAWITLRVPSDLHAVGLTAAFASALGQAGISCNVVAAARHDHLFVPWASAEKALDVLRELQRAASGGNG